MASDQVYGVTPPMNTYLPTEPELRATDALIDELKRENTFEAPTETEKR
jgi:poly(A) polymerase